MLAASCATDTTRKGEKCSNRDQIVRYGDSTGSSRQFVQQRLRLFQIPRVKPFGEPAEDRSEKLARLIALALIAPEPRHAHCGAKFPGFCLLPARNCKRSLEILFRFRY